MMKRPYVIVNCAMSADGKIALPSRKQLRISSNEDIKRVHQLRNNCDAVLIGIETVLSDDPKLTVKKEYVKNPKQPLRVVLDSLGRTPKDALVVNKDAKTVLIVTKGNEPEFDEDHIEVIGYTPDNEEHIRLSSVLKLLSDKGVNTLLVEGGGTVIWNFLKHKCVDDLYVYIGPFVIGGKTTPTFADGDGIKNEDERIALRILEVNRLGPGLLLHYQLVP